MKKVIAAFDFDNTLTKRDSLVPFLCATIGKRKTYLSLLKLIPNFLSFVLKKTSRQCVKEAILTTTLAGFSQEFLEKKGTEFAAQLPYSFFKKPVLERLRWHQEQNHECILVSAGLDIYLQPWGKLNGFSIVIASKCAFDSQNKLTGQLEGSNCWGPEKVKRLVEKIGSPENQVLYVYGDSQGDAELLSIADFPFYRYGES